MIQFLLAATVSVGAAEIPQAAQAALARATRLYADGAAHAASFVQTYTPAGFASAKRESGTIWIQTPQRLRFDYSEPEAKVFTYDDGEGRFYSPADKQLDVKKLSPEERARLPIVFLTKPAELASGYAITVEPAPDGAERLVLLPRQPGPELARMNLTVGADGTIRDLAYEDEAGNRTEFRFEKWRAETARPAADYRVTGPKGTRVVPN
jgi:outer membrane lipoprotein carrier protein